MKDSQNGDRQSAWRTDALRLLKSPSVTIFLIGALPPSITYIFLAGHIVTEPGTSLKDWPLPFVFASPVIAIVAAYWVLLLGFVFIVAGFPSALSPLRNGRFLGLDNVRVTLFATLFGSVKLARFRGGILIGHQAV